MSTEVVLDCARLKGVLPYDRELREKRTEKVIGHTIGDLFAPPAPDLPQLQKDWDRDGMVVKIDGVTTLCRSVEAFEAMQNVPEYIKNYILRVGHQGIFGGQASCVGPTENVQVNGWGLIQDSMVSDTMLTLSINSTGQAKLVQSTNYKYYGEDPEIKLGNAQLSLVADLTNLPMTFSKNGDIGEVLEIPMHLSVDVSGQDAAAITSVMRVGADEAVVGAPMAESVRASIREARYNKLLLAPKEELSKAVKNRDQNPGDAEAALRIIATERDVLADIASRNIFQANALLAHMDRAQKLSEKSISQILAHTQDILIQDMPPTLAIPQTFQDLLNCKADFFVKVFEELRKLSPEEQRPILQEVERVVNKIPPEAISAHSEEFRAFLLAAQKNAPPLFASINGHIISSLPEKSSALRRLASSIKRFSMSPPASDRGTPPPASDRGISTTPPPPPPPFSPTSESPSSDRGKSTTFPPASDRGISTTPPPPPPPPRLELDLAEIARKLARNLGEEVKPKQRSLSMGDIPVAVKSSPGH